MLLSPCTLYVRNYNGLLLLDRLALKWEQPYSKTMAWVRIRQQFAFIRAVDLRLRGARKKFRGLTQLTALLNYLPEFITSVSFSFSFYLHTFFNLLFCLLSTYFLLRPPLPLFPLFSSSSFFFSFFPFIFSFAISYFYRINHLNKTFYRFVSALYAYLLVNIIFTSGVLLVAPGTHLYSWVD